MTLNQEWRWLPIHDGDHRALALYLRHYSRKRYRRARLSRTFVGPGEKMVLLTVESDALFVWHKFDDMRHEEGVNNSIFRNEGLHRSSDLIREACGLAWDRWPGSRLYTYVNGKAIRSSNPGYCFQLAGWSKCGTTKGGLTILEIRP